MFLRYSVILAAANGAADGLRLAVNIGAMLIAFVSLIALVNRIVGGLAGLAGSEGITLERMSLEVTTPEGQTALMAAAQANQLEAVQLVIEAGADVNARNKYDGTAVMSAVWKDNRDIIKVLLDAGAQLDLQNNIGMGPVAFAAWGGHLEMLKELLDRGARLDQPDGEGWTELMLAINPLHGKSLLSPGALYLFRETIDASLDANLAATQVAPNSVIGWENLGSTLFRMSRVDEARTAFDRAYSLNHAVENRLRRDLMLPFVPESREQMMRCRAQFDDRLEELARDCAPIGLPTPALYCPSAFLLAFHGENDVGIMRKLARLYEVLCPQISYRAPHVDHPAVHPTRLDYDEDSEEVNVSITISINSLTVDDIEAINNIEDISEDEYVSNCSSFYGALKVRIRNQYGPIGSIVQLPTSSCYTAVTFDTTNGTQYPNGNILTGDSTVTQFGGDVYINRYTEKNTFFYFYDWLEGQPDGAQLNYAQKVMVPYPTYWANFNDFQTSDFTSSLWSYFGTLPSFSLPSFPPSGPPSFLSPPSPPGGASVEKKSFMSIVSL